MNKRNESEGMKGMSNIQELIIQTVLLLFLAAGAYMDFRTKKVSGRFLLAFFIACVVCVIYMKDYDNPWRYIGFLAGIIFCVLSYLSRQAIGLGDAVIFAILGFALGIYDMLLVLFFAFCLTAVIGIVLLIFKRIGRKTQIPFLPFLFVAYACVCLIVEK